jgi:hypothetical protein
MIPIDVPFGRPEAFIQAKEGFFNRSHQTFPGRQMDTPSRIGPSLGAVLPVLAGRSGY